MHRASVQSRRVVINNGINCRKTKSNNILLTSIKNKMINLSEGAVQAFMAGTASEKPVLQILRHKKVMDQLGVEKYRLWLSDGSNYFSWTHLADTVDNRVGKDLTDLTICMITKYRVIDCLMRRKSRRFMYIEDIDVKVPGSEVARKIGLPLCLCTSVSAISTIGNVPKAEIAQKSGSWKCPQASKRVISPLSNVSKTRRIESTSAESHPLTPIHDLDPRRSGWFIKAKVIQKSGELHWNNGGGRFFYMTLSDESGQIYCKAFNAMHDLFFKMFKEEQTYCISRGCLKKAMHKYKKLHEFDIHLTSDTEVTICDLPEKVTHFPEVNPEKVTHFPEVNPEKATHFLFIREVMKKEVTHSANVVGIVVKLFGLEPVTGYFAANPLLKRHVLIVDSNNDEMIVVLWQERAKLITVTGNPVMAIQGGIVSEYNGKKYLNTVRLTKIELDLDIPEVRRLRRWWNDEGKRLQQRT